MGTVRKPTIAYNGLEVKHFDDGLYAPSAKILDITLAHDGETSNTDRTYVKAYKGDLVLTSGADQLNNTFPAGPFNNVVLAYNESTSGESHEERLETTKVGIHVGDDQTGTYVAGGNMSVTQTGWGFAFGQDHVVAGHNNFVGGDGNGGSYGTSAQSDNNFLMGYANKTENKVTNSFQAGSYTKVTSTSTVTAIDGAAAIGHLVHASGSGALAIGRGIAGITPVYTNADGTASFAGGRGSFADGETSFAFGRRQDIDSVTWRPQAKAAQSLVFGPCIVESDCTGAIAMGAANHIGNSGAPDYSLTGPDADYGFAIGKYNFISGDYSGALGYQNITSGGNANIAIGQYLKTPVMQNDSSQWISGTSQVVVGQYNNTTKEYSSAASGTDLYTHGFVNPLYFSVGTGSSDANRYTSFAVGPRSSDSLSTTSTSGFCGIIMEAVANSPDYNGDSAAAAGGVPIGGLYRYPVGQEGSGAYLIGIRMA